MQTAEAPAPVAEGTDPSLPAVAPEGAAPSPEPSTPEQQPGESDSAHRRRIIEAAKRERRAVEERRAAERARSEAAEQAKAAEAMRSQFAEMQARLQRFEQTRQNALRDPKALLAEVGLDLDTIVRAHLDEGPTPDVLLADADRRTKGELEALRAEIEKIRRASEEREQAQQQERASQAATAIRHEIVSHLRSNADNYELTLKLGQEGEVFELMKLAYQEHGTVLDVAKAADMIEEHLFTQAKEMAQAKKLAALFKPQEPAAAPPGKPGTQAKQATDARVPASVNTLTSKLATPTAQPSTPDELLDRDTALDLITKKVKAAREAKRAGK